MVFFWNFDRNHLSKLANFRSKLYPIRIFFGISVYTFLDTYGNCLDGVRSSNPYLFKFSSNNDSRGKCRKSTKNLKPHKIQNNSDMKNRLGQFKAKANLRIEWKFQVSNSIRARVTALESKTAIDLVKVLRPADAQQLAFREAPAGVRRQAPPYAGASGGSRPLPPGEKKRVGVQLCPPGYYKIIIV